MSTLNLARVSLALCCILAAAPAVAAALQVGVDHNGDGLLRLAGHGDPRAPVDETSPEKPFVFWLNTDQDDRNYYETWPLDRADYETQGIDSLRDLEDFTRLVVQVADAQSWQRADTLRFTVETVGDGTDEGAPDAFAVNLYQAASRDCRNAHLTEAEAGHLQRSDDWNMPVGTVQVGEPTDVRIARLAPPGNNGHWMCFLLEGRHEGLGGLRVQLLRQGRVLHQSAPAWISIRHVKRLYQRVTIPWPEDRKDIFEYDEAPPPLNLSWEIDPQGFRFEPPWYETDDVIVWVYGWLKSGPGLYEMSTVQSGETIFKRLWHRGYRGRLVLFHWPTVKHKVALGLLRSEYRGYKSGPALMDHVHSYPPDKRVHVTAHSLGGVPLMAALRHGMKADTALFQAAAVPAEVFDTNPDLIVPELQEVETPLEEKHGGYHGLLTETQTRIYSLFNVHDITFYGWDLAQRKLKGATPWRSYEYDPDGPEGQRLFHDNGRPGERRPVTDLDEARAFITRPRTHAIGGEPRVRGLIREAFDLDRPPHYFGAEHVAAWGWNPQRTTAFYNLVLDIFNIPFNSELL
jgi:hypothetical protein